MTISPVRRAVSRRGWLLSTTALAGPLRAALAASVFLAGLPRPAAALPQDGQVRAGGAAIRQTGPQSLEVEQSTGRAAIDWRSFSIGADEQVRFRQPGPDSITLNRVTGGDPSSILGRLKANGQVVLVNPNGVLFGPGAVVDVASLVATTSSIADDDFMAGRLRFLAPGRPDAAVVNQGAITVSEGGFVAMVAPHVANEGVITARFGRVALASGDRFTLDLYGDGLVSLAVSDRLAGEVANSGQILADGGRVALSAATAREALNDVVNMSGVIRAETIGERGGAIVLDGGDGGTVRVAGALDASGREAGEAGGSVKVLGDRVGLFGAARIDASGTAGGGEVLVGGNLRGGGAERRASAAYVAADAGISASATERGAGGRVIVWADGYTRFDGRIDARGGAQGGDGGFVETSGKAALDVTGAVDAAAPFGAPGVWLLDPRNVTITNAPAGGAFDGGNPNVFTPNADNATVLVTTIVNSLNAGTSVTITTGATGGQDGDITIASAIAKNSANDATLRLEAADDIFINQNVTAAGGGKLNLEFIADADSSGAGFAQTNGTRSLTTSGGYFTLPTDLVLAGGNLTLTTAGGDVTIGGDVTRDATARSLTINAGTAGDVSVAGSFGATGALSALTIIGNDVTIGAIGTAAAAGVTGATGIAGATNGADVGSIRFTGTAYHANAQTYTAPVGGSFLIDAGAPVTFRSSGDAITFNNGVLQLSDGADLVVTAAGGTIAALGGVRGHSFETVDLNTTGNGRVNVGAIGAGDEILSIALSVQNRPVGLSGDLVTADAAGNNVTIVGGVEINVASVTIDVDRAANDGAVSISGALTGPGNNLTIRGGAVQTAGLNLAGAGGQAGGALTVRSAGAATLGAIDTRGGAAGAGQNGFAGGAIDLLAGGALVLVAANAAGAGGNGTDRDGGAAGAISLAGASVQLGGNLTATGGAATGAGAAGAGGAIQVAGPATLAANTTVSSGGANVAFGGSVDSTGGSRNFVVAAGAGDVSFGGPLGALSALSILTVSGNDIALPQIGTAGLAGVNGATTITAAPNGGDAGSIVFSGTVYNANTQTYAAGVGGGILFTAGAPTTFRSSIDTIAFSGAPLQLGSGVDLTVDTNGSSITLAGGVLAAATSDILLGGSVSLTADSTIDGGTGGDVTITGALTGAGRNLSIRGATVQTAGLDLSGGTNQAGGALTVQAGGAATLGSLDTSAGTAGAGQHGTAGGAVLVTSGGALALGAANASGANGNGTDRDGGASGAITLAGSAVQLGGGLTARGGTPTGTGVAGAGGAIAVTGPTTLAATVTAASGGAPIVFSSSVDSVGAARAFTVTGGLGDVSFGGPLGAALALSSLTVTGNDVTLAQVGSAGAAGVTGATSITAAPNGGDAGSIVFTGTIYNANAQTYAAGAGGALTATAGAPTTFRSSIDTIAFSGAPLQLGSGVDLTVDAGGAALTLSNGVVALASADISILGPITATGDLTLDGGAGGDVSLGVNFTAAGRNLTFRGRDVATANLTTTGAANQDGGSIVVEAAGAASLGTIVASGGASSAGNNGRRAGDVTVTAASAQLAAVTANGSAGNGAGRDGGAGGALSVTAAAATLGGALSTTGGTAGAGGAAGTGGAISIAGPATLGGGVTSGGGNVAFSAPVTLTADLTVNAGTGVLSFGGTVAAGANDLTLIASEMTFGGALGGTGLLALRPGSAAQGTTVGGAAATAALDLTAAKLALIQPGHSALEIGRADGSAALTVLSLPLADPVTLLNGGGTILVPALTVMNHLTIDSGGAAALGALDLAGYDLTLRGAGQVDLASVANAGALSLQKSGGAAAFAGSVQANSVSAAAGAYDVAFLEGFVAASATLANGGALQLGDAAADVTTVTTGGFTRTPTTTLLGRLAVGDGDVELAALTLGSDAEIDSAAGDGDIRLGAVAGPASALVLTAGAGEIAALAGGAVDLAALAVQAGAVSLQGSIAGAAGAAASALVQRNAPVGPGPYLFNGAFFPPGSGPTPPVPTPQPPAPPSGGTVGAPPSPAPASL